ncbi:MAG TPA: FtsX-like permease family protein, partial [Vicinamibacterales bacterium]|nr:FtsX-like permease family protein [Vicinamibacterales bacterium]
AIATQLPGDLLQRGADIPVDFRAWLFAFSVTAMTAAAFVLVPMFSARKIELSSALGPGARTGRSATESRARTTLLIGQVAMTLVLVFGAALFLKSFAALTQAPLGFEPANRITMRTTVGPPRYVTPAAISGYVDELLAQARAIPGVHSAAAGSSSPLGSGPLALLAPAGEPSVPAGGETRAILRTVTPGYFQTVGIPILRGRAFSADDHATGPRLAIVNETAARRLFGDLDAVGRQVDFRPGPRSAAWMQKPGAVLIAGVAANIKEVGVNEVDFADLYLLWSQAPAPSIELIVRAAPSASIDAQALKRATAAVDPAVPVVSVSTLEQRVSRALQNDRFNMMLISSFAAIAVLLAIVGIYGAIAYVVEGRRREFGVRLALGARPRQLISLALWQAGRVGIAGGLIGVAAALILSRALGDALYLVPGSHNGLLYGVTTLDPLMLGAAFIAIVALALGAGLIPARRVGRVNPMLALRNE